MREIGTTEWRDADGIMGPVDGTRVRPVAVGARDKGDGWGHGVWRARDEDPRILVLPPGLLHWQAQIVEHRKMVLLLQRSRRLDQMSVRDMNFGLTLGGD